MSRWKVGDIRNGYTVLNPNNRKTILLLSDDFRMFSGVATVSREIIYQTCHHYNWIQVGAGLKHPEHGKIINVDTALAKETKVEGAKCTVFPIDGYGNAEIIRYIMKKHDISAIMHFTDPRQWEWLYRIEREIRKQVPLLFYTIWDDLPYPQWNKQFYNSCDGLFCINKQTKNIINTVLTDDELKNKIVEYVPHGINSKIFKPIQTDTKELIDFKNSITKNKDKEFIILYNSRNIRRKMTSDIMIAYKYFVDSLPKNVRDKVLLVLKTQPVDMGGTDLFSIHRKLMDECDITILPDILSPAHMNYLYNIADVTVGASSAEGFGLSIGESIMAGTPVIATVIGGLQDQMRFEDSKGNWIDFDTNHPTNSDGRYKKHGPWAFPLWPQLNLVGSPPTPYIYDSRPTVEGIVQRFKEVYNLSWLDRNKIGKLGREWFISDESNLSACKMGESMIKYIDKSMNTFTKRESFSFEKIEKPDSIKHKGLYNKTKQKWL